MAGLAGSLCLGGPERSHSLGHLTDKGGCSGFVMINSFDFERVDKSKSDILIFKINLSRQIILCICLYPWDDPDCRGLAGLAGSLCLGGTGKVTQFGLPYG